MISNYMKWVKQKTDADCAVCALSMVTDIPYTKLRRTVKNNSKFCVSRKIGTNKEGVQNTLKFLGIKFGETLDGTHSSVASMMGGNRGILAYRTKDGGGHAVAWDGFKVYDPCTLIKKSYSFSDYATVRPSLDYWMWGFTFKTPWYIRVLSLAKGELQSFEIKIELREWITKNVNKLSRWLHVPFDRRSDTSS